MVTCLWRLMSPCTCAASSVLPSTVRMLLPMLFHFFLIVFHRYFSTSTGLTAEDLLTHNRLDLFTTTVAFFFSSNSHDVIIVSMTTHESTSCHVFFNVRNKDGVYIKRHHVLRVFQENVDKVSQKKFNYEVMLVNTLTHTNTLNQTATPYPSTTPFTPPPTTSMHHTTHHPYASRSQAC